MPSAQALAIPHLVAMKSDEQAGVPQVGRTEDFLGFFFRRRRCGLVPRDAPGDVLNLVFRQGRGAFRAVFLEEGRLNRAFRHSAAPHGPGEGGQGLVPRELRDRLPDRRSGLRGDSRAVRLLPLLHDCQRRRQRSEFVPPNDPQRLPLVGKGRARSRCRRLRPSRLMTAVSVRHRKFPRPSSGACPASENLGGDPRSAGDVISQAPQLLGGRRFKERMDAVAPALRGEDGRLDAQLVEDPEDRFRFLPDPLPRGRFADLLPRDVQVERELVGHAVRVCRIRADPDLPLEVIAEDSAVRGRRTAAGPFEVPGRRRREGAKVAG